MMPRMPAALIVWKPASSTWLWCERSITTFKRLISAAPLLVIGCFFPVGYGQPNAAPQLLSEAGAQRTLEAVSCRRLFGQAVLSALWLDGAHTCISRAVSHLPSFSRGQLQGIATSRSSDFLTSRLPGPLARGWKADRSDVMLAPAPCARRLPASSLRLPVPGQL